MAKGKPDPIDVNVGARLRTFRMRAGVSQEALGDALGLTFQQVQKYEKGTNRIAPSRLVVAAKALKVPVAAFYGSQEADHIDTRLDTRKRHALIDLLEELDSPVVEAKLVDLLKALVKR